MKRKNSLQLILFLLITVTWTIHAGGDTESIIESKKSPELTDTETSLSEKNVQKADSLLTTPKDIESRIVIQEENAPEIVVQMGHSNSVFSVAFSPDGNTIVSGSHEGTLKLWDVKSGREIRSFSGHSFDVWFVAFSPDGKTIVSGSGDDTLKLWDVISGREIRSFSGHSNNISSVAFSPDGKTIISGSRDETLKLWDVKSGREIRSFSGHSRSVTSVAFSPDGNTIVSGSDDNTLKLWDVKSGREIRSFSGHSRSVTSVAFSPDGNTIVSGSDDNTLKLWDVTSGREIRSFSGHSLAVSSVAFSPDGNTIVSGSKDKTLKLWDVTTGREIRSFSGHPVLVHSVAFSPDGNTIISGSGGKALKLWDVTSGREIRSFSGHSDWVLSTAISPDGKTIVSCSRKTLKLWDVARGRLIRSISGHSSDISSVAFSPDGKTIVSGFLNKTLKLWDVTSGREIRSFSGHSNWVASVAFSPDGKTILSGSGDKTLKLWDFKSGREIRTFSGYSYTVSSVAFSPDGKTIASGSGLDPLKLWDVKSGREIRSISGHSNNISSVAFSPDGKTILSGSWDKTQKLWDVASGREIRRFSGHSRTVWSVAFSPDGKTIVSGSGGKALKLWDVTSGREIRNFSGHTDLVTSVAFSPNGKTIVSSSRDNTFRIWNINTGEFVAFMSARDSDDWLIFTNDGYWDSSKNGGELVAMVNGMDVWNIDQFAVRNNRPDIILQRLGSDNQELIDNFYSQYKKRLSRLGLTESDILGSYDTPKAEILESVQNVKMVDLKFKIGVSNTSNSLYRYNIYVNDVPLFGSYGKETSGKDQIITEKIELTSGENKIEVSCMNNKGAEAYRDLVYATYDKPVKGNLYYLGFGVSDYADPQIKDLNYADNDIMDQSALFSKMKGNGFNNVYVKTYTNSQVTPDVISKAKSFLANAGVDDTFVLSIAGHGLHDKDAESTYYYITHNTRLDNLKGTAVTFETIEELLQGIAPRQKLFLMDTCDSGQADRPVRMAAADFNSTSGISGRVISVEGNEDFLPAPRPWLNDRDRYIYNDLYRRSGAIVFSSSNAGEISFESSTLKNGYFTEEVLNALTSRSADTNRDGTVSTEELYKYVSVNVRRRSEKDINPDVVQTPTIDRDNIYVNFGFPVVK